VVRQADRIPGDPTRVLIRRRHSPVNPVPTRPDQVNVIRGVPDRHPPDRPVIPAWRQPGPVYHRGRDLRLFRVGQQPVFGCGPSRAVPHALGVVVPVLHPPLRQGMASATPGARRMSLEDFLRQVAAREGAGADEEALFSQVFEHVRAVFGTLSEAASRKEWFDIVVELPEDHRPLMPAGIA
jgi:hypothetical protein